jgi:hypothetical protein
LGVVEHQRVFFDADAGQLPAEDLGGEQPVAAQADQPAARHRPVYLDGLAVFDGWQGGGPGGNRAGGGELGQVVDRQVRAQGLDPGAASGQVDQVAVGPEPITIPARAGPTQNWRPATVMFPHGGTTRSNSTGPPFHSALLAGAAEPAGLGA